MQDLDIGSTSESMRCNALLRMRSPCASSKGLSDISLIASSNSAVKSSECLMRWQIEFGPRMIRSTMPTTTSSASQGLSKILAMFARSAHNTKHTQSLIILSLSLMPTLRNMRAHATLHAHVEACSCSCTCSCTCTLPVMSNESEPHVHEISHVTVRLRVHTCMRMHHLVNWSCVLGALSL